MTASFVDTNILVYAFDLDEPEKKLIAETLLRKTLEGYGPLHISNQIIAEFARTLTQKIRTPYPTHQTKAFLQSFYTHRWIIHPYSLDTINSALELLSKYNTPFWDALIAATMMENHIYQIYTEDMAFNKIPGIKAVNPFKRKKS